MLIKLFNRLKKIAWFLPGFLMWAAFPPMAEKMDILFALAPLMWLSRQGGAKESAKRWFQSGIFYWVATLSWMPAIVKNNGPWPLVVLGWFALAAYCSLFFAACGWFTARYWRWAGERTGRGCVVARAVGILLVEPVLWCGFELLRSRLFGGFAWNQLGVVPVNAGFGAPAALGGVYLCSAAVILINGSIAGIVERVIASVKRRPVARWRSFETLLAFAAVWGLYSAAAPASPVPSPTPPPSPLKVALIQRNFPCCFKGPEDNPYEVYGKLAGNIAALNPDLVVLSESAMCEFGPVDQQGALRFAEWLSKKCGGAAVLAGGTRFADTLTYNSAALYTTQDPSASPAFADPQIYDKVHLVPFGEFIPGDKWFPVLQQFAPVGSCTPGEVKLLMLETAAASEKAPDPRTVPCGAGICFEDTDSALMREFAAKGARMLVFITNDSWFSHSNEALAHAWQATARAIETGLPVVRVGNSGVTGTITPEGKCNWLTDAKGRALVDRRAVMFDRVMVGAATGETRGTIYVRLGDWPLGIMFALLILTMIMVKYTHERKQRRSLPV